jgi:hypothetical protein
MIGVARLRQGVGCDWRSLRVPALATATALLVAVLVAIAPLPRAVPPLDSLSRAHLNTLPAQMAPVDIQPYCVLAWSIPPVPQVGLLPSCDGLLGSRAAAATLSRYGARVLGAELVQLTLYARQGRSGVDQRPTWILSVDRYLADLPGWASAQHDCSPGRVLVLLDARSGKPIGEFAWGTLALASPGDPCNSGH